MMVLLKGWSYNLVSLTLSGVPLVIDISCINRDTPVCTHYAAFKRPL